MPHLADEAFAAVGDSLDRHVELAALHPAYRARFADGTSLDVHTDGEAMEAEVGRFAGTGRGGRLPRSAGLAGAAVPGADATLHRHQLRLAPPAAPPGPGPPGGAGRLRPAGRRIGRFLADPRLRRVFSFQSLYAGVAPARALAAYAVIAYMDTVAGVWFPRGGMHALPRGDGGRGGRRGCRLPLRSAEVTRLERSAGRVTAVRLASGERIACDAVVLTRDLPAAHRLLGRAPPAPGAAAPLAVRRGPARRDRPHLARPRPPHPVLRRRVGAARSTN